MPDNSFDVVSIVDMPEVLNAIQQARKEIQTRFDLKNSKSEIDLNEKEKKVTIQSADDFKVKAVVDVLQQKLAKRKVPLKNLTYGPIQPAACYTADEAVRTARLGREAGLSNWVKLEVIGDEKTLFPDTAALIEATKVLVKEGFIVLPYTNDDLIVARRLIDAGAAAIMPLGAPIGSGMGIQNFAGMRILREMITEVPLIVDAGVGTASDATVAMELGADGVLMNTGIAGAADPGAMAEAMNHAVRAGRLAFKAGRISRKLYAAASSPIDGVVR